MHAHFGDPLVVEGNYFFRLPAGRKGKALEEGYRIFDLDNPTKVVDITGRELGEAQVISTKQTKFDYLSKKDIGELKNLGLKSKEQALRTLNSRYSKNIRWVTFVIFIPVVRLVNREPFYKKEVVDGR
ncbi:MAG: hypothetical protein A2Y98_01675 [Candidatus Portnoybacteria bacterium RBG_19FT_COMBO_36_7]|uniref:Uncharacterized protein n=1 Tax=Candidatus Portnoybacteria bacterium RBG_19FT_COMBO_36_7 TaxID=1801992 RepID=A0A1G2F6K8_9BACT|nr:MAG: hypothetical protein A2Y98_01675 [Candidatus Portnoybacteria bacterium RBG_19FT_COMBO_36_7]